MRGLLSLQRLSQVLDCMGLFGGCGKSPSPNLVASFFGSLGLHPEWRDVDPLGYIFDGAIRCREKHQFGAYNPRHQSSRLDDLLELFLQVSHVPFPL
jgi:hypothetical protein